MRWLNFSIAIVVLSLMVGCAKEDSKGISTVDPNANMPAVEGGAPSGESGGDVTAGAPGSTPGAMTTPGAGGISTPPSSTGTSGTPPNLPPADEKAVAAMTIPTYPGATKQADSPDTTEKANGETTTVVTRFTKDSFDKVKAFYADKAKWTEKNEVDGLIIYESVNGGTREIVGINDQGDLRSIVVTRITKG